MFLIEVYLDRSPIEGIGVFTKRPIARGELIWKFDPLIDRQLELERLQLALEANILTPYVKENGIGGVDPARLDNSIKQLATALKLTTVPAAADIWTDQFLPPAADRKL